jgi:hypothetical protein
MGKFDNYKGKTSSGRLPAGKSRSSSLTSPGEDRHAKYIAKGKEAEAAGRSPGRTQGVGQFAIALDATGSMASLIDGARQNITTILNRIYDEAGMKVQIRMYVYRDYDVKNIICESSSLTADAQDLARWLGGVRVAGGGANDGEAIEAAFEAIYEAGEASAVLLAGDEPSNPRRDLDARGLHETPTAQDWARRFAQQGVPIHTFAVGAYPATISDFQDIARLSGGQAGRLDGTAAMLDMAVMAMLSSLKGAASVRRYMERYALSDGSKKFGMLLLSGPRSDKP